MNINITISERQVGVHFNLNTDQLTIEGFHCHKSMSLSWWERHYKTYLARKHVNDKELRKFELFLTQCHFSSHMFRTSMTTLTAV